MSKINQIIVQITLVVTLLIGVFTPSSAPETSAFQATAEAWAMRNGDYLRSIPGTNESAADIDARGAWRLSRMTYPTGQLPKGDWRSEALAYADKYVPFGTPDGVTASPSLPGDGVVPPATTAWTTMGPRPVDTSTQPAGYKYGTVSGRVNAITFVPGSATTAYAGSPAGGLWKTTTCCSASTTWTPLWDDASFAAQSVGAIAIDPTNTNIVYVGTGDSQPAAGDMWSNGIFKSTDAGTTWTQYGANVFSPYASAGAPGASCCVTAPDQNVKALIVDPNNPSTVIAGASYGVFISRDAGVTWTQYDVVNRNAAPYTDDAQRVTSMLLDQSTNPSTLYVALGYPYTSARRPGLTGGANGVYKATLPASGAPSFTLMNSGWPTGTGNGTSNDVGRIEMAFNAARTRIYATVSNYGTSNSANVGKNLGIYTSANGGTTWTLLSGTTDASYKDCARNTDGTQDWYDLYVGVDPNNDKTLYVGRVNIYKVTVGSTYSSATVASLGDVYGLSMTGKPCGGYGKIHPDQHAFAWVPGTTTFLAGNDGGIFLGSGAVGGFTQLNNSISTMQFYAGQLGRDFANTSGSQIQYAFGGFQDNGNASWSSANTDLKWQARAVGGDGFFTAFDPIAGTTSAGRWYTEYTYGDMDCSTTGAGGSFTSCAPAYSTGVVDANRDWSTPFLLDQWNCTTALCNNLILGSGRVWASVSTTRPTWTATGSANLTKGSGAIVSMNVGHKTPGSVIVGTNDGNIQWSPNVFTGANCTAALANTSSFSCTVNTAATWVNLTGSNSVLPNRVIGGVAFDPNVNTTFYAALDGFSSNTPSTPGHIFMGSCSASPCTTSNFSWANKSGNLPDVPAHAVQVNPNNPAQVFLGTDLGFYYTNDITVASPVWNRFQTGMPNTVVQYLAVDRGPASAPTASTTLGAFTYGRGLFTLRLANTGYGSIASGK